MTTSDRGGRSSADAATHEERAESTPESGPRGGDATQTASLHQRPHDAGESETPDRDASGDNGPAAAASAPLRVLFDVAHPAQVHLFRNAITDLQTRGHETFVSARDKEVTLDLLDAYGIEYRSLSTKADSLPGLIAEHLVREVRLAALAREFDADVIVSRLGPVPAHAATLAGARHVAVSDTRVGNDLLRRVQQTVTLPFVDTICAPAGFDLPIDDASRRPLDVQELAYLHPRYFEPDPSALGPDLDPETFYAVIRVAGWDAYHDVGERGLSLAGLRSLVETLDAHGTVVISAEGSLPDDLESYRLDIDPSDIHHVLAFADLYVGDSGTMSTEAAVLGTPAIRTNSAVGDRDEPVFKTLDAYGLLESYANEADALAAVDRLLTAGVDREESRARRERLIADRPDPTEHIVETILESAPEQP
ncbi:DUF354 domain-containing protein [Halococcoides cellulosivorans]|uniref:DUF354 domain-containing protein n=1 Tax=Halococcoides cellulosivorans TaxID=1679096 RepID=UPI00131EF510|nr:DUF354 domain-containing protein [Halococcoides cellulosivorans]